MATLHVTLELPEWEDPDRGYRSLQGQIVREAVDQLFGRLRDELSQDIRTQLREQINASLGEILADIVQTPIRKTNNYGEPVGQPISLRELIIAEATRYLQEPVRRRDGKPSDYHSDDKMSRLHYLTRVAVQAELTRAFSEQIGAAVDAAKATIENTLTDMIKDAVKSRLDL